MGLGSRVSAELGAPEKIQLAKLESWTANADAGVKYFSGTASYSTALNASEDWFAKGTHVLLDLGKVNDLATVFGQRPQTWHALEAAVSNRFDRGAQTGREPVGNRRHEPMDQPPGGGPHRAGG